MSGTKVVVRTSLFHMIKELASSEVCNVAEYALTFVRRLLHRMLEEKHSLDDHSRSLISLSDQISNNEKKAKAMSFFFQNERAIFIFRG